LEVLQGIAAGEQVIVNPSDSLQEGDKVNIANNKAPGQNEGQKQ